MHVHWAYCHTFAPQINVRMYLFCQLATGRNLHLGNCLLRLLALQTFTACNPHTRERQYDVCFWHWRQKDSWKMLHFQFDTLFQTTDSRSPLLTSNNRFSMSSARYLGGDFLGTIPLIDSIRFNESLSIMSSFLSEDCAAGRSSMLIPKKHSMIWFTHVTDLRSS